MKLPDFKEYVNRLKNDYVGSIFMLMIPVAVLPTVMLVLYMLYYAKSDKSFFFPGLVVIAATGYLLVQALKKVRRINADFAAARATINAYVAEKKIPECPAEPSNELELLQKEIQDFVKHIDSQLTEKSDMIDLLSHDLRSPVARIMGLCNLLKLDDNPETVEYAEYIHAEGKNLLNMLESILLMFKEGAQVFEAQNVNLSQLVDESVQFFKLMAADKNLTLQADVPEDLFINVQAGLFTQAIRNIVGNAIKFSTSGKTIYINAQRNEEDQSIVIKIKDEGVGMKSEDLNRIFERFTKAGKKGTNGEVSFGLGMYLSKKIIERQGGKIIAESEGQDKGAVFSITLYQLITKKGVKKRPLPVLS